MEKFTGADLTEICQRAAKIAIRENIMKVRRRNILFRFADGDFISGGSMFRSCCDGDWRTFCVFYTSRCVKGFGGLCASRKLPVFGESVAMQDEQEMEAEVRSGVQC